ncbi:pentatricopeptide repeat-containing protein At3g02650, mitochondrial [Dioscorea cayenensis subsp. rotundata]|uniref:Pentatricopeptide repeat-containing protein At3g02650, mitochondrial n=1 Tax=Dioscorea cayennensis subsp. rotundata TaxID=55577 RepID=A0AB40ARY4_DIOCR|nr:pentatricopeptide repeat-containing protein At3g02650, mitochondrial [Dioscorea cayenensis subsp. rotundata]
MWSSKARQWLLRIPRPKRSPLHRQVPQETLIVVRTQPDHTLPTFTRLQNPRLYSTNPSFHSGEADDSNAGTVGNAIDADDSCESEASSVDLNEKGDDLQELSKQAADVDSLSSLWEESVGADDSINVFGSQEASEGVGNEIHEVDDVQVESVLSLLQSTLVEPLELSLDKMDLRLSEAFAVRVIQTDNISGENLVGFFKWASRNCQSVKCSRAVELLVLAVSNLPELWKEEAYMLWDLVKEIGVEKGMVTTVVLNDLISMFWKLGKSKAGLEVFEKFTDFGCVPDGDSYYYTIEALGKRSMFDTAWSVCEKMIDSGNLRDKEKIGKIIAFFCKGKKAKEAYLVYLVAKDKEICQERSWLDLLVHHLAKNNETVCLACELLDEYDKKSLKNATKSFADVVKGLCRIGDVKEAEKLVLRMVESGPAPAKAVFNSVITSFSRRGEMEDAIALMKVMESKGLRPDVYTYTVVMSGYAKGGMMDEAYNIFSEARKRHSRLSPATYHVLTRGYCKMEEYDKAIDIWKEMKKDGMQANTDEYNKMIQSLCLKALDWRKAEQLLEEMKEDGVPLKEITRSLIAAVKSLEEEQVQSAAISIEA